MSGPADWSTGYRVAGGRGPTVADLEELTFACRLLEGAADRLDQASWTLLRAAQTLDPLSPAGGEALRVLTAVRTGAAAPWRVADHLRQLAAALRRVVELYTETESAAHRVMRTAVAATGGALGELPVLAGLLGAVGVGLVAVPAALAAAASVGPAGLPPALAWHGKRAADDLTADGRAELGMVAFASFVRATRLGLQIPTLRPVPDGAKVLFGPVPPAGPTALLVRADPPQLPAPRSVGAVLDNVARSYDRAPTPFAPGTPAGVISVQQLTHPDGTRAWVVEIPGTEDWGLNDVNPMDLTTNGRLLAGLPDDMTDAVLDAMRRSGVGPDEPVMLAGHSQGGMVAMSVAAAVGSAYSVRAVVTAGAPDIPQPAPTGVEVRHYRHTEDLVPQLDGTPDQPDARVTVVTRDLSATGGPAVPSVLEAHAVERYVETAEQADRELAGSPGMREFDAAARDVLGPPGTTAVTRQFQATRDPTLVAAQPPQLRPSS
jgi:hypothetical protein